MGIRELRASLSKLMRQVRGGSTLTVTDHGAPIALILPADVPPGLVPMVADGRLKWRGRPGILPPPLPTPSGLIGHSLSDAVIEERDEDERSFDVVT